MQQTTIRQRIQCTGVGLHSGKTVKLTMRPAAEDTGIVFHIVTPMGRRELRPAADAVIATGLATTLGKGGAAVSTVEHLLAALRGLCIDNLHIDVEGGEIPILDGSAAPFVMLFSEAGVHEQSAPRKVYRIKKTTRFSQGDKYIRAEPYDGFCVDYTIAFSHPSIGTQRKILDLTPQNFSQVAKARTFGFLQEVEMLKSRGLALGGSLDNAIVLDERGVVNEEGLRCPDEFVRHKLLDFIGDMAMLPLPLQGRFTVFCSGHGLNNEFLRHITASEALYLETLTIGGESRPAARRSARRPVEGVPAPVFAIS